MQVGEPGVPIHRQYDGLVQGQRRMDVRELGRIVYGNQHRGVVELFGYVPALGIRVGDLRVEPHASQSGPQPEWGVLYGGVGFECLPVVCVGIRVLLEAHEQAYGVRCGYGAARAGVEPAVVLEVQGVRGRVDANLPVREVGKEVVVCACPVQLL